MMNTGLRAVAIIAFITLLGVATSGCDLFGLLDDDNDINFSDPAMVSVTTVFADDTPTQFYALAINEVIDEVPIPTSLGGIASLAYFADFNVSAAELDGLGGFLSTEGEVRLAACAFVGGDGAEFDFDVNDEDSRFELITDSSALDDCDDEVFVDVSRTTFKDDGGLNTTQSAQVEIPVEWEPALPSSFVVGEDLEFSLEDAEVDVRYAIAALVEVGSDEDDTTLIWSNAPQSQEELFALLTGADQLDVTIPADVLGEGPDGQLSYVLVVVGLSTENPSSSLTGSNNNLSIAAGGKVFFRSLPPEAVE